ncbi:hypothetical protein [Streptomyces brasiliensis]|uniref:Uncharacterized protein n=1 Tax=Streptomyces brasiliensis TaxID=1954 RepID=A0A917P0M8_9ACTN|nr:hypothetical protein [Streptomyces brasiliensis]GGJ48619.1 hypothetical protein GCM10010121_069670 [Streptomyces brasiliensis]
MTTGLPEPAGFPECPACAYVVTGTARLCSDCAGRTLQPVSGSHCSSCSQAVAPGRPCGNRLCALPVSKRGFSRVDAVAVYPGVLRDKIHRLKYDGAHGWAMIFGRPLVGWMESHPEQMEGVDHVVGNPTAAGRQPLQHIEAIMNAASRTAAWTATSSNARRPSRLIEAARTGPAARRGTIARCGRARLP